VKLLRRVGWVETEEGVVDVTTIFTMPVATMDLVLLLQQYLGQIPRFSARQTHLVRQKLPLAFGAQVLAAAGPGSEPEDSLLGAD